VQEQYEIVRFELSKTLVRQGFPAEEMTKAIEHFESAPL
jgi:hypothetical protein